MPTSPKYVYVFRLNRKSNQIPNNFDQFNGAIHLSLIHIIQLDEWFYERNYLKCLTEKEKSGKKIT